MRICVGNKQEKGIIFMENIAINKSFMNCILTASRLYAVWRLFLWCFSMSVS